MYGCAFVEECVDGKEFSDCANKCPLTCRHKQGVEECIWEGCEPGCVCPDNQFMDNDGNCVENCPCYVGDLELEIGVKYPSNESDCEEW